MLGASIRRYDLFVLMRAQNMGAFGIAEGDRAMSQILLCFAVTFTFFVSRFKLDKKLSKNIKMIDKRSVLS